MSITLQNVVVKNLDQAKIAQNILKRADDFLQQTKFHMVNFGEFCNMPTSGVDRWTTITTVNPGDGVIKLTDYGSRWKTPNVHVKFQPPKILTAFVKWSNYALYTSFSSALYIVHVMYDNDYHV